MRLQVLTADHWLGRVVLTRQCLLLSEASHTEAESAAVVQWQAHAPCPQQSDFNNPLCHKCHEHEADAAAEADLELHDISPVRWYAARIPKRTALRMPAWLRSGVMVPRQCSGQAADPQCSRRRQAGGGTLSRCDGGDSGSSTARGRVGSHNRLGS
jgi:hypothetical protein